MENRLALLLGPCRILLESGMAKNIIWTLPISALIVFRTAAGGEKPQQLIDRARPRPTIVPVIRKVAKQPASVSAVVDIEH